MLISSGDDRSGLSSWAVASGGQDRAVTVGSSTCTLRSASLSTDGRLLVSTGEYVTVRVWSLTDLDQLLGKRGLIRGLQLKTEHQTAVV